MNRKVARKKKFRNESAFVDGLKSAEQSVRDAQVALERSEAERRRLVREMVEAAKQISDQDKVLQAIGDLVSGETSPDGVVVPERIRLSGGCLNRRPMRTAGRWKGVK